MSTTRLAVLLLVACNGGKDVDTGPADSEPVDGDADTDADADADSDSDADTDTVISEFGLDTRPPNLTCIAPARPIGSSQAQLTRTFTGISHDHGMMMLMAPGDSTQWYLIEKVGRLWRFDNDPAVSTKTPVMDLTGPVYAPGSDSDERGLLGMAFHPDFQNNGYLYLYYSAAASGPGKDHESHLSRFTSTDGGLTFDPSTELVVMVIDEPFSNHNGGTIAFGPDGNLYLGLGDGGSAGDPGDRAQDPNELLGKMLRIDVDGGTPYAIPADNPFAGGGGRPEIFAMGLRNPFRFSFDSETDDLWVGDVGQYEWEEISKVELGGNYGWNVREGYECYSPSVGCASAGFAIPFAVYPNNNGASIVGGVVYHGDAIPGLRGTLLYSDFYSGDILGLFFDPVSGLPAPQEVVSNTQRALVHYTTGADGEVYVLDYNGQFTVLEPLPDQPIDTFPRLLSQTGCFDPADPSVPTAGLIPYDVAHPFWSDGADKRRWVALPEGGTITIGDDGDWDLPIGSVVAKEFSVAGERIETRLLVLHDDGVWGGYAYAWNDDQTDAEYVDGGRSVDLTSQLWAIPDTGECARCHTVVGGGSLGLENAQLNTTFTYASTGLTANQIATLDHIGMFTTPAPDATTLGVYPAVGDSTAPLEDRARAYLHVNCAQCHQPDGPSRTEIDFRYTTALADTNICNVDPAHGDLDVTGAKILVPGEPSKSVLSLRTHRRDANQMPPLGSTVVDEVGVAVLDEWITSLSACP